MSPPAGTLAVDVAKPVVPFEVTPILHESGARTYVVIEPESRDAVVVDPLLETVGEVLRALSAGRGVVKYVVDTHTHGDHLSGALFLHQKTGADVVMSIAAESQVATRRVAEGDLLALGDTGLKVRAAPGVSPDSIVLEGTGVLFSGDTLLVGTIGVRDAPGSDGAALYDTMQRVFEPLADETVVHPGHDDMGRSRTTIRAEKRGNRWLREKDRETFLARWTSDPRPVAKTAVDILAANRQGTLSSAPELATITTVGAPAKGEGPVVSPQGMGAARTGGLLPEGIATVALVAGAASLAGCVLGFLVHRAFHLLPGLVGIAAIGVGLASGVRRPKPVAPGLYYLGPQKRTPLR